MTKSKKRKRKSLSWIHVLHKMWQYRHFNVVAVQRRQRNVEKKSDARAKLLFFKYKPIAFCRSRCGRRRRFKVPFKVN